MKLNLYTTYFMLWLLSLSLWTPSLLNAMEIDIDGSGITGNFDTTITVGAGWRVEKRDDDLIGTFNGGKRAHVNGDDGNLNFDRELISQATKVTNELHLNWRNFGLFVRGHYFYDSVNANKGGLSGRAKAKVGADAKLLDAYISGDFTIKDHHLNVRVGKQVLSWGESTFIPNGINIINPIDVAQLRSPGSEIRNALIPVPMFSASYNVSENINIEGFYQFNFEETEIDPVGSFFSVSDIVGSGGKVLWLGAEGETGGGIPRSNSDASEGGQFGFAARAYVPALNETEFGLFYINYHSRLPILSFRTGTLAGLRIGDYAGSSKYIIEYPNNIHLFGLSFNTMLIGSRIALAGEFSFRTNMPLQINDNELIAALFTPLSADSTSQVGSFGFNREIRGYKTKNVSQAQITASRVFGPTNPFRASRITVIGEAGFTYVSKLEDKNNLSFDGPESSTADAFSWGYNLLVQFDYENAIGPIKLTPTFAFSHDVNGITPGPPGNFLENRMSITTGLSGSYLQRWKADLKYTSFFGAEHLNVLQDRDFVVFNIRYSF
ncbi:MAG: DUF1302 domain-containing protein [Candidatus Anammoxibacter sp.]